MHIFQADLEDITLEPIEEVLYPPVKVSHLPDLIIQLIFHKVDMRPRRSIAMQDRVLGERNSMRTV